MNPFNYQRVSTAKDAIAAINKTPNSAFLAGGTNLIDLMKSGVTAPEKLIDINPIPLTNIEKTITGLRIGAMAKNSDVSEHELILKYFPLLSKALKAGASPQLRNMATVGGNMMQRTRCPYFFDTVTPCNKRVPESGCSAIGGYNRMHAIFGASTSCIAVHPSDMCVALAALNATINVSNTKTQRKILFTDFHRLPADSPHIDNTLQKGELIVSIDIPFNNWASHTHYLKVRDRASYAFALVSVAVGLNMNNNTIREAYLAMGGVAHKPWRLKEVERFLKGKPATEATFIQAASIAMKDAKGYGENNFKLKLAPNSIVEALRIASQ